MSLRSKRVDDAREEVVEVDVDGAGGVAVEAEGLLGDLGDAGEFLVGGFEQMLGGWRDVGVGLDEVDEVGDGFERVVDLVGDGGGEAAGGGELFGLAEGGFLGLASGDVLHGADHADDFGGVWARRWVCRWRRASTAMPSRGVDAVLGAVEAAGLEGVLEVRGGDAVVFFDDDALAQGGAGDGDVRVEVEELGGALVEVEEVGGAVPGPGAELGGVEGLARRRSASRLSLGAMRRSSVTSRKKTAMPSAVGYALTESQRPSGG